MNAPNDGQNTYGVTRMILISPEAAAIARRNWSRVYVAIKGDSVLDTLLFQPQRSMDDYLEATERAIHLSGLKSWKGEIAIKSIYDPLVAAGLFQQHIITNSWLVDDKGEVYDIFLELDPQRFEALQEPDIATMSPNDGEGFDDNPMIYVAGLEQFGPEVLYIPSEPITEKNDDDDRVAGGQGRVKDPTTDRRIAQNRQPQLASARQPQTTDDNMARQAGKPGRVRNSALDFRRKDVRQLMGSENSAGR